MRTIRTSLRIVRFLLKVATIILLGVFMLCLLLAVWLNQKERKTPGVWWER